MLAGWPTPDAQAMNVGSDLATHQARLARLKETWGNGNGAGMTLGAAVNLSLTDQVRGDSGTGRSGSPASTAKRGALASAFVAWLMGFPPSWLEAAPTSSPRSRSARHAGRTNSEP